MLMYAYFAVRSVSIGVDFVLGTKRTLKPGLIRLEIIAKRGIIACLSYNTSFWLYEKVDF